ncbi:protein kinase domain-containing protein [Fimbriiglobus ruber]|uniref:non-specific serine/threonine protein kinase n=1 Tax=Fimbriiglobus ruber TaxID=1908690 RepID=A0A225D4B1_9BACT|nr:protein kinase [Fimbriiglobus ruber]OWK36431.1 Serine/threonine protein kinase PrkC, regulator of stationary phase [Fimbriiglobus ruber]
MPPVTPPASTADLLNLLRGSGIHKPGFLGERLGEFADLPQEPNRAADVLVRKGLLTRFQAKLLLAGRHKGFRLGPYIIRDQLGQGGMGTVYLAEHETLRRRVALKVLQPKQKGDHRVNVERFLREARAAAALDHPNIVRIHDVSQDGGIHYLGLEYVEGQTLEQLLTRGGPITPSLAVGYIAQAAAGLQHAHEKGFVHRDIKPANLMLTKDGTVKILDMGLARSETATDSLTELIDKGAVVGTADYISPEQALGNTTVDIRADIYSLGATFFVLATSRPPFEGNTSQKLVQHQMKAAPNLTDRDRTFPPELAKIIAKMLAKKPADRYQTPADVIAALAPWLSDDGGQKVVIGLSGMDQGSSSRLQETLNEIATKRIKRPEAKPEAEPQTPPQPIRRGSGKLVGAIAGAVVAALAIIGVIAYAAWPASKPTETAAAHPAPVPAQPASAQPAQALPAPAQPAPPQPAPPQPANVAPAPVPEDVKPAAPKPAGVASKVSIKAGVDGFYVQTPKYEAVIDKLDGCLSSFSASGVEFLRCGAGLAANKTTARGGYFYSEKNGHQGLVKLTDIQQPAPNVIVATGGSFSVRYEFGVNQLTVTGQNATDDTVPYYLLIDSAAVQDVINEKAEELSVPVARKQGDPLDPKWRTTTWVADKASLKVTDLSGDGTARIWGPFSEFQSQVWEADAKTYNNVQFTLEPVNGPERPKAVLKPGGVLITRSGSSRRVRTELYEATVDANACMPSLRVDGVEVLKANIDVSKGVYFLPGFPLPPFDIKQPSTTTISAQSDKAAVQYDFGPNKMTWTVENRSDQGMPFFVVMDTTVTGVCNDKDVWAKTPTGGPPNTNWATSTWYAGRAKFKMTGGSRIWGPWQDKYQVWEASLAPKEKRTVTVELGLTDATEAAKLGEITGTKPLLATALTLDAPMDYQVFQRKTKFEGAMTLNGRVRSDYDRLEVRTIGKSLQGAVPDQWREVPLPETTRSFETTVPTPAGGWYKVEVRAFKDGKVIGQMAVDHVGIGEVFIGAGQSNSTNCGQEKIRQNSGMVSSFSGTNWQLGDDPQPGVHDNSAGGSFWPAFGDAMFEEYQVPIGVASTGHSGTSVNQWAPGSDLCRWTTGRMNQLGKNGFRAVLWHQGESDVSMPADEYARKMTALIKETRRGAGWDVPWFVAQVSYHNPNQITFPLPRAAQKKLWESGTAFEGPDTDTLTGDNRDEGGKGIHFSAKGLKAHGKMWAEKVAVQLDKELAK